MQFPNAQLRCLAGLTLVALVTACNGAEGNGGGGTPDPAAPSSPPAQGLPGPAGPASTDSKIQSALSEGKITPEEGWRYRLAARFNPAALPEEYRPDANSPQDELGSQSGGDRFLNTLIGALPTLSNAAQKEFVGYLIPPSYVGSAHGMGRSLPKAAAQKEERDEIIPTPIPQEGWTHTETTELKIWWQADHPDDEFVARRLIGVFPTIKNKLDALMGKTMISDAGVHRFRAPDGTHMAWGDGGNGKLDIYVGHIQGATQALTVPYLPGCSEVASFMLFDRTQGSTIRKAEAGLAHEYMHVLQNTFTRGHACDSYNRVDEGTANFAIQYVFPQNDYEKEYDTFFKGPHTSLASYDYHTWPFYLFMERTLGSSSIRDIFENNALLDGIESVNQALPGGFAKQFPLYTIREWNQTEVEDDFRDWDGLDWKPQKMWEVNVPTERISVQADARGVFKREEEMGGQKALEPLSRRYFHFVFDDPTIRSVDVAAVPGYDPTGKLRLKVLIKRVGREFEAEDWSEKEEATEFCRDVQDEKIEEMVLIFSNVAFPEQGGSGAPKVQTGFELSATRFGCKTWRGEFRSTWEYSGPSGQDSMSTSAEVTFEREGVNATGNFVGRFKASEGSGNFVYSGRRKSGDGWCSGNTSGVFTVVSDRSNTIGMYPHQVGTPNEGKYLGGVGVLSPEFFLVTYHCGGNKPPIQGAVVPNVWSTGAGFRRANPDGTLSGTSSVPGVGFNYEWMIRPVD
ncbi:MAG: hypothetical protein IT285_07995 [Bdellovibrionales bacterium]|nr:hypothetical protein [Bdellovibrionales bacterium]